MQPDGNTAAASRAVRGSESHRPLSPRIPPGLSTHCPSLDGSAPRGTTRQHKTHKTEYREVRYPWHPLFGQRVVVRAERRRAEQWSLRCAQCDDPRIRGFEMPAWMFDEVVCAAMRLADEPRVIWTALAELRKLLDDATCVPERPRVEVWHHPERAKGDADACSNPMPCAPIEGLVRPTSPPAPLGEAPRRRPPGDNPAYGPDASGPVDTSPRPRRDER